LKRRETKGRIDPVGTAAMLAAMICWTTGPLFIRYLSGHLDAWSQNLWRYTVAMLFWLPYLLVAMRRGRAGPNVWKRAIPPTLANIVMQSLWAWSYYFIKPGFAVLLSRSSLIWTAGFCLVYFPDERGLVRSSRFWLGMLFSVTGLVTIIVKKHDFTATASVTGIIIMLSAAAGWALYTILARVAFKDIDPRTGFSVVSIYTVAGLAILAALFGRPAQLLSLGARPVTFVVISGILSISLAHTLYYTSILRIGATIPALMLQLSPFATLLLSMAFFAERLNAWQWAGGMILLTGSALSVWAQQDLRKTDNPKNKLTH